MNKIIRVLGRRGRITIPFELRAQLKLARNDILSFRSSEGDEIIIRRERICDGCAGSDVRIRDAESVIRLLDDMTPEQQYNALVHLSLKWAEREGREDGEHMTIQ